MWVKGRFFFFPLQRNKVTLISFWIKNKWEFHLFCHKVGFWSAIQAYTMFSLFKMWLVLCFHQKVRGGKCYYYNVSNHSDSKNASVDTVGTLPFYRKAIFYSNRFCSDTKKRFFAFVTLHIMFPILTHSFTLCQNYHVAIVETLLSQ